MKLFLGLALCLISAGAFVVQIQSLPQSSLEQQNLQILTKDAAVSYKGKGEY